MRRPSLRICIPIALAAMILLGQTESGSWAGPWQDQLRQTVPTRTPEQPGATRWPPPTSTPVPPSASVQPTTQAPAQPTATQSSSSTDVLDQTPLPTPWVQTAAVEPWTSSTEARAPWPNTAVQTPLTTPAALVKMPLNVMSSESLTPFPGVTENAATAPTRLETWALRASSPERSSLPTLPRPTPPASFDALSTAVPRPSGTPLPARIAGNAGIAALGALLLSGAAALFVLVRSEKRRG
jgi:hypothetical protein